MDGEHCAVSWEMAVSIKFCYFAYKSCSGKSVDSLPCSSITVLCQDVSPAPELQGTNDRLQRSKILLKSTAGLRMCPFGSVYQCLLLQFSHPTVLAMVVSLKTDKEFTHPVVLYINSFRLRTFTFLSHALDYSQARRVCVQLQSSAWKLKKPKLCMFLVKGLAGHDL